MMLKKIGKFMIAMLMAVCLFSVSYEQHDGKLPNLFQTVDAAGTQYTLKIGSTFNAAIKTLANGTSREFTDTDLAVHSIAFYPNGATPAGITLSSLTSTNVDDGNTGTIKAYWNSTNAYIYGSSSTLVGNRNDE